MSLHHPDSSRVRTSTAIVCAYFLIAGCHSNSGLRPPEIDLSTIDLSTENNSDFAASSEQDFALALDLTNDDDLAAQDFAAAEDLAVAQDFAAVQDLAVEQDFAAQIDLAAGDMSNRADLANTDLGQPSPPPYDSVCTQSRMGTSIYDPDCVYLFGTVNGAGCGGGALVLPSQPDDYVIGFDCYAPGVGFPSSGVILPNDGHFLYNDFENGARVAYEFIVDGEKIATPYPSAPTANDLTVPTPACPNDIYEAMSFRDGTVAYLCNSNNLLLHIGSGSDTLTLPDTPMALGPGRSVLVFDGNDVLWIVTPTATTKVNGLPALSHPYVARSTSTGFLVVFPVGSITTTYLLYDLALDGTFTVRGQYNMGGVSPFFSCVLEPSGALDCFTWDMSTFPSTNSITRFSLTAPPLVLYNETSHPVKIVSYNLITGP